MFVVNEDGVKIEEERFYGKMEALGK